MKLHIALLIIFAAFLACKPAVKESSSVTVFESKSQEDIDPRLKLQVYYFHNTHRCSNCISIEERVKNVLNNSYVDEMKDGVIKYAAFNVDETENKELVEKYMAYGATLILAKFRDGKEEAHDLTNFAFDYISTKPDYFEESIRDTISYMIN